MNHIRYSNEICPEVLSLYHFKSDEQKRLAYEYKSCKLLLEKLTAFSSPTDPKIKHRVQALKHHITQLEGNLDEPSHFFTQDEARQTLQKIEQIRGLLQAKSASKETLLPVINSLPKQVRNYLVGMVYAYHPQRKDRKSVV